MYVHCTIYIVHKQIFNLQVKFTKLNYNIHFLKLESTQRTFSIQGEDNVNYVAWTLCIFECII